MYDAAIIGAGPAGATLARLLADKYKILLVDKRPADDDRGKCCGGLLAPDAQKMIARLGLGLPKSVLVEPQLFVVRAIDLPRRAERYYQRFYINMDRGRFDRWLLSMVPPSVDVRLGCRFKSFAADDGGVNVSLSQNGAATVERARILVGADGASSRVRAAAMPERTAGKNYFAVQHWMESDEVQPFFSAIFDPELTDFYCWTIPKGDLLVVGAALRPKDDAVAKFESLKQRLARCGFRLGKTVRGEGAFLLRSTRADRPITGGKGVALVGEAGGWISPSSAEGLSYAFHGAMILADVLRQGIEGFEGRYRRAMRTLRWTLTKKRCKSRIIFHPPLRRIAMQTGLGSVDVRR
ncbi:MAG: FAD-binding protein [Pirellulales bacterium]|nr:FAD-binding protein [Pirellulales bacterium]